MTTMTLGRRDRSGYSLSDLCVTLAAAILLLALIAPTMSHRLNADRDQIKCASNLRMIALSAIMYGAQSTRDNGKFPRTYYNPSAPVALYTGRDAVNAFSISAPDAPPVPQANDVTAAFYHLLKSSDVTSDVFICPASDATPFQGPPGQGIPDKSNFAGPENLSYSYSTPYGTRDAVQNGFKFDTTLSPDYPLAADINPGDSAKGGPTQVAYQEESDAAAWANSPNHYYMGQNVAYVDGRVEWQTTVFAGAPVAGQPYRDNVYTSAQGEQSGTGKGGAIKAMPQTRHDFVMLPTIQDTVAGGTVTLAARSPGGGPMKYVAIGVGVVLLLAAVLIVVMSMRKKPVPTPSVESPAGPPPVQ